jgi:anti-sigma factor RsiW
MPTEREVAGLRCGEVLALLSDYLDGDLDTAAREKVEGHVRGCDQCARFGGRFAAVVTALRQRLAPLPPVDDGVAVRLAERLARGD